MGASMTTKACECGTAEFLYVALPLSISTQDIGEGMTCITALKTRL